MQTFIEHLPKKYLYTFEFRHKSWFCEELYELLHKHQLSLCFYNHKMYCSPEIVTGQFIYIRMHGPNDEADEGTYDEETLLEYAQKFIKWNKEGNAIGIFVEILFSALLGLDLTYSPFIHYFDG